MSKEQSQRMGNDYNPTLGIMTWVRNRDGLTIASVDLNKIRGANGVTVQSILNDNPGVIADVILLGVAQKIGHGAAVSAFDGNRRRTDSELWDLKTRGMQRVIEALYTGETRVAASRDLLLRQALERIVASSETSEKGKAVCERWIAEWIGIDKEEKARIAALGPIRKAMLEIEAERLNARGMDDDEFDAL